jgi:hypothetical protein
MFAAATTPRVGRKMEFPDRITLPLAAGVVDRIDAALEPGEPRLDLIRDAIDRELRRRERVTRNPATPPSPAKSKGEE